MAEWNKRLPRPIFRRDVTWDPLTTSLPPFLEPSDQEWIHWAKRRLDSLSGPGSTQFPLLPLFSGQHTAVLNQKGLRQPASGVSEIQTGRDSWKINLDVNHFSPEEITVTTKEGYLLISGIQSIFLWLSVSCDANNVTNLESKKKVEYILHIHSIFFF